MRSILRPVVERGYYDYILIDTNPNLSLLNFNIVNASNYVLIPAQPASFDLDGLAVVLQFVEGIKPYNPTLQVGGIIINRYDARNRLITEAAMDQLGGELQRPCCLSRSSGWTAACKTPSGRTAPCWTTRAVRVSRRNTAP